jgi:uncharacterized iron-regulated membrane protein
MGRTLTRAVLRRLHRYIGLTLALPLILQALTGLVLATDPFVAFLLGVPAANGPLTEPDDLRNVDVAAILAVAHGAVSRRASCPAAPRIGRPAANVRFDPMRSIAAGIASSEAALPKAVLQDLRLPAVPGRPMIAVLLPPGYWVGAPVTVVSMDPVTAEVSSIQDPQIGSAGMSVLAWLRAAHEGGAAGPVGRLLLCLFALALVLLPVTGFAMWTLRWRMRHRGMAMTRAGAVRQ